MKISTMLQQATTALDLVRTLRRELEIENIQIQAPEESAIYEKLQAFGLFSKKPFLPNSSVTLSYWINILVQINSKNIPSTIEILAQHLEESATQKENFTIGKLAAMLKNLKELPPKQDITTILSSITQVIQQKTDQKEWIDSYFISVMINALKGKKPSSVDPLLTALISHIEQNKPTSLVNIADILEGLQSFEQLQSASNIIKILTTQFADFSRSSWESDLSVEKWLANIIYHLQAYFDNEKTQPIAIGFIEQAEKALQLESLLRDLEAEKLLEPNTLTLHKEDLIHPATREWFIMEVGQFTCFDFEGNIEAIDLTGYPFSIGLVKMVAAFIQSQQLDTQSLPIYFEEEEHEDAWRYTQQIERKKYYSSHSQQVFTAIFNPYALDHHSSTTDHSSTEETASTSSDGDKENLDGIHHSGPLSLSTSIPYITI